MSLMKTLAKVAIGVAVAKGAKSMMDRNRSGQQAGSAGGLGGLLGGLLGGGQTPSSGGSRPHGGAQNPQGGGLDDILGGVFGGSTQSGASGGLGGLLNQLGGSGGGGLGGLLAGMTGAAKGGGLLDGADATIRRAPESNVRNFGEVLNSQFDATPEPVIEPSRDQEAMAGVMLAAMIQAAKSDGHFDNNERAKLLETLGEVDAEEAAFVERQMQAPIDVDGLASQVPKGMEQQVYAMSLLGIELDTQEEAQYLDKLAKAMDLDPKSVNGIHEQMGVPSLYT